MAIAGVKKRTLVVTAFFAVVTGLTMAVLVPSAGYSWPWDDSRDIRVTGQVQCNGFDFANQWAFQKVEGFEIRGRSGVRRDPTGTSLDVGYDVEVPPGWKIEYSVKCSGNPTWLNGSFVVDKTKVGSSYNQTRNVCADSAISFAPCISRDYGYCIDLWFRGQWKPQTITDQVFKSLYNTQNSTLKSVEGCARAVQDSLPKLNSSPAPTTAPPASPLPTPAVTVLPTLPTAPTSTAAPTTPASTTPTTPPPTTPPTAPPPSVPPTQPPVVTQPPSTAPPSVPPPPPTATVVIDNRVTIGTGMREDPNSPAYLSTVTQNRCRANGCMLDGTYMSSGATLLVTCQTTGARTTNGNDRDTADDTNPERFESIRWYNARWSDGRTGWISETWVRADGRGGLGLPGC